MPTFRYVAKKGPQETAKGLLDGENRAAVLSRLTDLGFTPLQIIEVDADGTAADARTAPVVDGKVPSRHLNQFTRQFASLVRSQVPLLRTLSILKDQTSHPRLQRVLEAVGEEIRQGETLSGALAKYPNVFPPLYISLTHAGELAGILDKVLDRLAVQADREEALRAKLQSAFAYPAFVAVVGLGTVMFLLTVVMPRLVRLFEGFGSKLPLPTRMLLTISGWCRAWWFWAGWGLVVALAMVLWKRHGTRSMLLIDQLSLRLPLLGTLIRRLEVARFARAFGLLLDHGIPILQATDVAIPVIHNQVIRREFSVLPAQLKEGNSLASCLKSLSVSTPFIVHAVAVGEEGGRVGESLIEVANYYEREAERLLQLLASLLEPAMILTVGGIVGFIVIAVLLPIFEMSLIAH